MLLSKKSQYNKEKFKNAVLFIAKNGGFDVGKKKLAKLLYFIDFTLFELTRGKSLTGLPYTKKDYGPMPEPKLFYKALNDLKNEGIIDIQEANSYGLEKIIPNSEPNIKIFDENELRILKQLVEKFKLETAGDLEKIAQSEPPYKMVGYGEEIPYYLAFYRNSFGEMDLNDD
ncbi:MAG: hypothetical protein CEN90_469 [Parcubacteria group bacterium Licking1014_17]|nr:MAG: hypothetical protein CEN90_469 [Parcubacteria group bacterium Licking1014_17]